MAIAGVVSLGGMELMKVTSRSKTHLDQNHEVQSVQKLLEGRLYSKAGCNSLVGKKVGDALVLNSGGQDFKAGTRIGKTLIREVNFNKFIPSDELGSQGVANIQLTVESKDERETKIEIPVPVTLSPDSSIEGCNLLAGIDGEALYANLCSDSFGSMSKGKSCAEVLALIQELSIKSICEDIYGSPVKAKFVGIHCDMRFIHANKQCAAGKAVSGFDQAGRLICKTI